jgi:hypothetical protein
VRTNGRRRRQRITSAAGDLDLESLVAERRRDEISDALLIVHHKDARPGFAVADWLPLIASRRAPRWPVEFLGFGHRRSKTSEPGRKLRIGWNETGPSTASIGSSRLALGDVCTDASAPRLTTSCTAYCPRALPAVAGGSCPQD